MGNMNVARQHGELVGSGKGLQQYIEEQIAAGRMIGSDEFAILGLHLAARLGRAGERSGGLVGPGVLVREYYLLMADCAAHDQRVEIADLPADVASIPAATRDFFGMTWFIGWSAERLARNLQTTLSRTPRIWRSRPLSVSAMRVLSKSRPLGTSRAISRVQ